jgi:hypothetical protein
MAVKTGMLVSEKGDNGAFPIWPFAPEAGGAVGQLALANRVMLDHAAHYDAQNRKVYEHAKAQLAKGTDQLLAPGPVMPNLDARRQELTRRRNQLAETKRRVTEVAAKALGERDTLKPFDFAAEGAAMRKEMRDALRTMPDEQRDKLIRSDRRVREAVAEGPAWLSGVPESQHKLIHDQEVAARDPERAAELSLELFKVVDRAIANEATVVGDPAARPPAAPPPTPQWSLLSPKPMEVEA